ncbi:glycosyltransferase family 1 protein [Oscillatoria sp. FACHB-1406]|uniref:glycosyltransferase family 4 protein n=1 Tax=Oscillatoria sp. FACHB-1406 TaxID=2692846 RepID=UPI001685D12B|nr:glycosyltransferase family 1 protein [Oscillatoria sp. FACHB-1406]MBD2578964.1 glycosyltransferase family 4 protein [Oscillatoria sp. FACHB-1406]
MKQIAIDGRQLSYPGTGLALVTAEFLLALQELGYGEFISVFIPSQVNLTNYGLENSDIRWIPVESQYPSWQHWLARAATIPDQIERLAWAKAVVRKQKELNLTARLFIPYLYNYGKLKENIVLIPDLIYRLVREEVLDTSRPWWWNLRYKLPLRSRFRDWEEKQVLHANRLVVYSEFVRDFVTETTGISRDRITLIPLATPSWMETEYEQNRAPEILKTHGIPARFVLYVGGYGSRKNVPMLLRICGKIWKLDPTFRCVFVGLTPELLQSIFGVLMRQELENPAVRSAIIALPGLDNRDLAILYRLAEFTVYPSLSEGFGLPILEAAAAEKLCLCGDNSSMKEVQPYAQYRIKSEDEEKWRDRILHFWQNPAEVESASRDCAKLVGNYSWQDSAKRLWEILQS